MSAAREADDRAGPARHLFRAARRGVLSTFSTRFAGFPYGSAVPFAPDRGGRPVVLVSRLAAHTQDLLQNPHASLTAHGEDVVTEARATLLGRMRPLDREDPAARRYLALLPEAQDFLGFADFGFYRLEPVAGHYIGGFGDIRWFDGSDYVLADRPLDQAEPDILAHMNADHADTLRAYCRSGFGLAVETAEMVTVDADGFDVRADGRLLRFRFEAAVADAEGARRALVALAHAARAS